MSTVTVTIAPVPRSPLAGENVTAVTVAAEPGIVPPSHIVDIRLAAKIASDDDPDDLSNSNTCLIRTGAGRHHQTVRPGYRPARPAPSYAGKSEIVPSLTRLSLAPARSSRSESATRATTVDQSRRMSWRKSRAVGYHGVQLGCSGELSCLTPLIERGPACVTAAGAQGLGQRDFRATKTYEKPIRPIRGNGSTSAVTNPASARVRNTRACGSACISMTSGGPSGWLRYSDRRNS